MHKHIHKKDIENVLILQGGGSLGAFACGVFKAFTKKGIKFDIISGTSIGAINGAIAVGSKNDNPEKDLEDFWIEIAESSVNVIPDIFSLDYEDQTYQMKFKRSSSASLNAAIFGVPKFFFPRWYNWNVFQSNNLHDFNILPSQWTYIYDKLPSNMSEVQSRAKDIMFTDKDQSLREKSLLITRQINLIETLYNIVNEYDQSKIDKDIINYIEKEHEILIERFGAKILKIQRISRENSETSHSSQNADFSVKTIKNIITQGEKKALDRLK